MTSVFSTLKMDGVCLWPFVLVLDTRCGSKNCKCHYKVLVMEMGSIFTWQLSASLIEIRKVVNSSKKMRARMRKFPQRDEEVGNDEEIDEDTALQKVNFILQAFLSCLCSFFCWRLWSMNCVDLWCTKVVPIVISHLRKLYTGDFPFSRRCCWKFWSDEK